MGGKRITIEYIKEQFERESYKLLTEIYTNSKQKLDYICSKGHNNIICWNNWQQGYRCSYCSGNKVDPKYIDYINASFKRVGYVLLTDVYNGSNTRLDYICPSGHVHYITWSAWHYSNQRCPFCAGVAKLKIEFIRSEFEKESYVLLADEYINNKQKLEYVCPGGHRHGVTWNNWKTGWRCPFCYYERNVGPAHPNWTGGCDPYCDVWLDKDFKESIKERDAYQCQNLYCLRQGGNAAQLTIHHIDYNKKHCHPSNLITLCRSCNARANKDREWHTSYYKEIMRRRNLANAIQFNS